MSRRLTVLLLGLALAFPAWSADYVIDTAKDHAFIHFRIKHLGFSWLYGRFNEFEGTFSYDEAAPEKSAVDITIDVASLDTNHAERDKHLRSDEFFDVERYPQATFTSTAFRPDGQGGGVLVGELTLRGVTRPVEIAVEQIGSGKDPWGGFRRGFQGRTTLALRDFGIDYDLGPSAREAEVILSIEGVRQ
ncbi:MAG: YceI family protein [Gammaproteobacteria bacterium]|nr:YceI family protein [Gammaproteobacteria bacterium]